MGEGDAVQEKPEAVIASEVPLEEKADTEEKVEEVADEKELKEVKGSELAETNDMQVDESQGKDAEKNDSIKVKETEDTMEIDKVVTEEGKEEVFEKSENNEKEVHEDKDDKESGKRPGKEKGSKKQSRGKGGSSKTAPIAKENNEEKNVKEQQTPQEKKKRRVQLSPDVTKTPTAYSADRPVRERKSVERLVASIEKDSGKDFHIEKGRGTALKDIPNVAYKLSRKKTEDTFKLLHTILFGRRGKAAQVKSNISRFSGFVWRDNEEKQLAKMKEKFDKCVKEKLVEFCDVLDIPVSKVNTRKEDLIAKLIEFLLEPHATTSELLSEKEQLNKSKKRKRSGKANADESGSKKSSSKKSGGDKSGQSASEESGEEEDDANGILEKSENEVPDQAESEDKEDESEDNKTKKKSVPSKTPSKEKSAQKILTKKENTAKKATPPKKAPAKSPSSQTKKSQTATPKVSSAKKKDITVKKSSTPKASAEESTGKKVLKAKEKIEKMKPTDDELKNAVTEILKEVDFNTATFTDILVLLAKKFNADLASRKAGIKLMIQDELTKLAEADDDDDEEEEGDLEKNEKEHSAKDVKA